MIFEQDYKLIEGLSAERGRGLSDLQFLSGYLYFENEAGAFDNPEGHEYPFPEGAVKADSYSEFLAAND